MAGQAAEEGEEGVVEVVEGAEAEEEAAEVVVRAKRTDHDWKHGMVAWTRRRRSTSAFSGFNLGAGLFSLPAMIPGFVCNTNGLDQQHEVSKLHSPFPKLQKGVNWGNSRAHEVHESIESQSNELVFVSMFP